MMDMNDTHITLNRSFYEGGHWNSTELIWRFQNLEKIKENTYNCMVHDDKDSPDFVYQCIRFLSEKFVCAVMEYTVYPYKGLPPKVGLFASSATSTTIYGHANITVTKWHELQTQDPPPDMPDENPCVKPFSDLAKTGLVQTFYRPQCQERLSLTATNAG
ncbi:uncharacterized protein LOC125946816 [Dermacentor silvarum]|uniref:uncharacterized protein LOC125946816 n=1 Tax=Dermacentor silvarum TaxID=543639 RepID=UPI002101C4D0|nr:uncharacterized protein LOC125946816 [Dermacentor silvarum]